MAGFHPAPGRRIIGRHDDNDAAVADGGFKQQQQPQKDEVNNTTNIDEIESDFSSDYDQPYHETASNWYQRHARRRARRLAGISSSSDNSSSSSSVESDEDGNDGGGQEGSSGRKEMEKAARSANRRMAEWLMSYPLVAARCCLSSLPPTMNTMTADTNSQYYGKPQFNNNNNSDSSSFRTPREQECKRLRRIFRRLHSKQKEFQEKLKDNGNAAPSSSTDNNSHNRNSNALSSEQMMRTDQACGENVRTFQTEIHSFLPQGTGISFIDAVLARDSLLQPKSSTGMDNAITRQQQTLSRLVLELNGPPRSGMTSILLAVAARYVASTSNIFIDSGCNADCNGNSTMPATHDTANTSTRSTKRRKRSDYSLPSATEPRVVILDLEKGIHPVKLILSVREAVVRRWEETAKAREWKRAQENLWNPDGAGASGDDDYNDTSNSTMKEQLQIEHAISSCLGRIHVVQPRDFTYLSLVATLESLRQSLDKEKVLNNPKTNNLKKHPTSQFGHPHSSYNNATKQQEQPPTLILIDSLTTLEASTRFQESLPSTSRGINRSSGGSGLSDRNEFYRQLIRLREEHEIAILGASRCAPSANNRANDQASRGAPGGKRGSNSSLWDKMVSHRVTLHHVVDGTAESTEYDFVASTGDSVFPYSVTAGGIAC
ncbi:hypothetical protein ACHAXR_012939 [Thalassiosira sp. AJA248-18]